MVVAVVNNHGHRGSECGARECLALIAFLQSGEPIVTRFGSLDSEASRYVKYLALELYSRTHGGQRGEVIRGNERWRADERHIKEFNSPTAIAEDSTRPPRNTTLPLSLPP